MNIEKLKVKLEELKVPQSFYRINGSLTSDVYVLNKIYDYWEYFYLALPPKWNTMTGIKQWKIKEGTVIFKGRASPQLSYGAYYVGGSNQIWVPNPKVNLID